MTPRSPFTVVPWDDEFLPRLLELALEETEGDIGRASFIFPHSRPARYLTLLLRRHAGVKKPLLAPRMYTVSALFSLLCGRIQAGTAWNAGLLDRVGLLLQCVREELGQPDDQGGGPMDAASLTDPRRFFPWGVRLAALFEECFSQCRRPRDFIHLQGQVSPYARALLERLSGIFSRYESGLAEREWTTPGHDASIVAAHLETTDSLPPGAPFWTGSPAGSPASSPAGSPAGSPADPVYIAGFHALSGAEEILFRHLWERGARVVLHADPETAAGKGHWSCRLLADWARSWGARMELCAEALPGPEEAKKTDIRYMAGYDLHSQITALREELDARPGPAFCPAPPDPDEDFPTPDADHPEARPFGSLAGSPADGPVDSPANSPSDRLDDSLSDSPADNPASSPADSLADTAIILPDSGLLLPVLHGLPRADINISMGYPLARSPLFRLVDTLLRLQERRRGAGYYWRDLVELLRHPYIKMLRDEPGAEAGTQPEEAAVPEAPEALRRELHILERALRRRGGKYIQPRDFLMDEYTQREQEALPGAPVLAFLERLLDSCLDAFEAPRTPADLAACLEGVCDLLLVHGGHLWPHFPIDAECMYRLRHSLIPELSRSALAGEPLERETLFSLLRSLMEAERVPFEADPLVGAQVMGVLESRLLSFRRVIVVDAVESSLPGSPQGDPLLPDSLRPELGLPSLHSREQIAAYHFFRLIRSAGEVLLLWRDGAEGESGGQGGKSRFIEELLWQEEQRRGALFAKDRDDPPLRVIPARVSPIARQRRALPVTPEIRRLLSAVLAGPVSASLLDAYLACPLRFFYERAARLAPADEVSEGDDPLAVGDMMHRLLQELYEPLLGRALPGEEALEKMLGEELASALTASTELARLGRTIPADSFAMLVTAGKKRLADYLLAQPPTTPLLLEESFSAAFSVPGLAGPAFSVELVGKADRIDLRQSPDPDGTDGPEACRVILDYKTGRVPSVAPDLWERNSLWDALDRWTPDCPEKPGSGALLPPSPPPFPADGPYDATLFSLADSLESVQLPFYLLLHRLASEQSPSMAGAEEALDARWVALGDKGRELPLFPEAVTREKRREIISDKVPRLVRFLLRHIAETPLLLPRPGARCDWCSSAKLCMVFGASAASPRR